MQEQIDSDPEDEVELPIFDPSQKKKKKKLRKKDSFDKAIDHALSIHDGNEHEHRDHDEDEDTQFIMEPVKDQLRDSVEYFNELADTFDFGKKKKKKKKKPVEKPVEKPKNNGESDYDYYELLSSIYEKLGRTNEGKGKKLNLPPIQLSKMGTTKTVWCNIRKVAVCLQRETAHLQQYTVTELAVNGNLNGSGQLVFKGRYQAKQIESVVRHYINDYVKCGNCGGNKTTMSKNGRLNMINCDDCRASKSVGSINKGYQVKTRYNK